MRLADERIPKRTLEMKLRGRRPRGRPRTRWIDQVMRDVEKRGKKWTQVKQDRDRWRFLCNSRVDPRNWKRLKEEEDTHTHTYIIINKYTG
jgi:hypothetical protein